MFEALARIVERIPYPIWVGGGAIAVGFVLAGFAAPVKAAADRARNSRKPNAKQRARRKDWTFKSMLFLGAVFTGFGTLLTAIGGSKDAQKLLEQTRVENEEARKETDGKLQRMLVALNAAKEQNTELLTQAKLRDIGSDFVSWAQDFSTRKPEESRHFAEMRIAENQKEIEISSRSLPIFGAVLAFLEQAAQTYAPRSDVPITVNLPRLPQNLFAPAGDIQRSIHLGQSAWEIYASVSRPAQDNSRPTMTINFTSPNEPTGTLIVYGINQAGKFSIVSSGPLPVPGLVLEYKDYDPAESGPVLRRLLQRLFEAQLSAPTPNPTPTPTATATISR